MDDLLLQQCLVGVVYICILYEIVGLIRQNICAEPEMEIDSTAVYERNMAKAMKKVHVDTSKQAANFKRFPSRNLYQMRSFRD
jgi:hypothetical protein